MVILLATSHVFDKKLEAIRNNMLYNEYISSLSDWFNENISRQILRGTNWAPLNADLFLSFYERDFMLSVRSDTVDVSITDAFNNTWQS